jgi:ribonuclease HI
VPTFIVEALAIGKTLEIIKKIDLEQIFMIFLDSESTLKGISNTSTIKNTSHITETLKDKLERLESRGNKIQLHYIPGDCEVQVNETADLEAKQSIKKGRDSLLLLLMADLKAQRKKKGKEELHSFCQNTKRDRGESYFERYYRNGSSPWFREIKMNCCAFVSMNHMRAGHSILKASLSRFNIVCTAECECGDELQTEEHIVTKCLKAETKESFPRQGTEAFPL